MKSLIGMLVMMTLAAGFPTTAFDLQGHRGARGLAPENTIEAFSIALSIGVTTLELDVGMTKDGVLVVHHDEWLNPDIARKPDGTFLSQRGPAIYSMTLQELKQYDVGRLKPGSAYAARLPEQQPRDGARIPTLAEVFELVRPSGRGSYPLQHRNQADADLRRRGARPRAICQGGPAAVRSANLAERVSMQSFDWRTLLILRRVDPAIVRVCLTSEQTDQDTIQRGKPGASPWTAGFDVDDFGGSVPRLVAAADCSVWSPAFEDLTSERIAEANSLGIRVIPWVANELEQMDRLIGMGVAGIITDYPNRLRRILAANNRPLPPAVSVP